jgi:Protein of unknown function (DUF2924)
MQVAKYETARRETGGPFRREDLAVGSQAKGTDTEVRIIALEALTTADLQIEWRRLYRVTPLTRLSRDLLIRGIAYRVQEQAHGGLSLGTKRRLRSHSEGTGQRGGSAAAPAIALKPGTKLVREWHGHAHTVSVVDDGFEYQGERYPSLTRIARRITGVHWSGPLFFGISKRRRVAVEGAADE